MFGRQYEREVIDNKKVSKKNSCFNLDNLNSKDASNVLKAVVESKFDY
ncbi:hypothetical protein ACTPDI_13520 [Clostridioides difficile]